MKPLTQRERRLIALGLLALVLAAAWLLVIGPLIGGFAHRAGQRQRLEATLQRDARLMSRLPSWRATAEAQRRSAARFAVFAPSESLAAEALKDRVIRLAADDGFTVRGIQDLQADAPAGSARVRADLTANLTQLCDAVRRLQNEGAYVVVDYLSISADRSLATWRVSPMDIRLEFSAPYRPSHARAP